MGVCASRRRARTLPHDDRSHATTNGERSCQYDWLCGAISVDIWRGTATLTVQSCGSSDAPILTCTLPQSVGDVGTLGRLYGKPGARCVANWPARRLAFSNLRAPPGCLPTSPCPKLDTASCRERV